MIAVLFARDDSRYKQLEGYDVYDIDRDARNYCKSYPVLAHPPCRAWGQLSHMANPRPDEKQLAYFALAQVRLNGGVLDKNFIINWQDYKNSILLTNGPDLRRLDTSIHKIIDFNK